MADIKISQLTAKAAKVESNDRIPIADFNGTTYDTKYVTGAQINELSLDTSPQLGGNLDVNGHTITSASNGNIQIRPNGTGAVLIGDSSGSNAAPLRFMELSDNGTNYVGLKAADNLTANTTYTLPTADGTSGQVLQTNGTGTLSWTNNDSGLTVNSTAITSGTAGRVFFQNASNQLSQSSNLFWDNTNNRLGIGTATPAHNIDVTGTMRVQGALTTASGIWDTTGLAVNNIRRNSVSTLKIDADGTVLNSLQISATSAWGAVSSGQVNGIYSDQAFNGTGSSSFSNLRFTGNHSTGTTGTINTIWINNGLNITNLNSTVRGFYYNPTITTVVGIHRAIETTVGNVIFNSTSGNVAIGGTSFGTSSDKVLAQYTGTAPGSSPADAYQQYSADITAGNAAPHFRTENGNVVKLYQQSSAGITTVSDLVTILQNLGLLS
jgi:hypothetical protein